MKSLLGKLGVILIGLVIFGYAEACEAQCAWVLWRMKSLYLKNPVSPFQTEWSRVVVVPDYKECRMNQLSAFRAEINEAKLYKPDKIESLEGLEGGSSNITVYFTGSHEVIKYECLPDTIDPRK